MNDPIEALAELQELEIALQESRVASSSLAERAEKELSGRIAEFRQTIPADVLAVYDRIRQKYPIPIVMIHEEKCTGCFLAVPRGTILDSRRNHALLLCPHCGRLLKNQPS